MDTFVELKEDQNEQQHGQSVDLKYVLMIAVPFGLFFNFINLYLSISMGFISIGLGSIFALLLGKFILGKKGIDKRSNLTLIAIAFGASLSAEASRTLLFLIWLALNADGIADFGFERPAWLLPGDEIINHTIVFSDTWMQPILVHWFLMLVPGVMGILLGLFLKNKFIHDDKEYPFPDQIIQTEVINVLTEQTEKLPLFIKSALTGFVFSAVTLFLGFSYIDISQPQNGWILGLSLGIIGVALFSVGFIIDRPKMTFSAGIASVCIYGPVLGPFLLDKYPKGTDFYTFFVSGLEDVYLSFTIGFLLGALILSGIFYSIIRKIYAKIIKVETNGENRLATENNNVNHANSASDANNEKNNGFQNVPKRNRFFSLRNLNFILLYMVLFIFCVGFVYQFRILGDNLFVTFLVVFWIMGIGSAVTFYLSISSSAKSSTSISPPFIFDLLPIYLVGIRNSYTPFIASPVPEIREGRTLVNHYKLAQLTKTDEKFVLKTFLVGYLAAAITTPFFALILWSTIGIGTPEFPAPTFPFEAALVSVFASGDIGAVIDLGELIFGGLLGMMSGANLGLGAVLAFFFPPHMAIPITLGAILRIVANKRYGVEFVKDKGVTILTGASVGASAVLIPLVLFSFL
ncbi:MAG: hypothetical protein ACW98I_05655 [Candidatus Hodarchaeales archaeon]|jgi:hypothetical protein